MRKPVLFLVPVVGLEPTRYRYQRILSPSRLPFHHAGISSWHSGIIAYLFEKSNPFLKENAWVLQKNCDVQPPLMERQGCFLQKGAFA